MYLYWRGTRVLKINKLKNHHTPKIYLRVAMPIYTNDLIDFFYVQVVMNLADPKLIAGSFAITFGEVIHSLFGCWNGQLLINESMKLHTAV